MGPLFHFTTNFLMVWLVSQAFGIEWTLPVVVLAIAGGLFPDFTHHVNEFLLAAFVSVGAAFVFAYNKTGEVWIATVFGAMALLVLLYIRKGALPKSKAYQNTPKSQWTPEMWKKVQLTYSLPYFVVFGLAAFLFTGSLAIALVAFLCYALHASIDWLTYGTWFGLKNMAKYKDI